MEFNYNEEGAFFIANLPSIIDLYDYQELTLSTIIQSLDQLPEGLVEWQVNDNVLRVKYLYQNIPVYVYLLIVKNKDNLKDINRILVEDKAVEDAEKAKTYVKSYIDQKENFVEGYYAQLSLLNLISKEPILIVDCSQWCLFSAGYLKQMGSLNINIVESNLFKVKLTDNDTLFTEGLGRFGIKDLQMINVPQEYQKVSAEFLSRLARYFIENGQIPNSCQEYPEVFEGQVCACLIEIDDVAKTLLKNKLIDRNVDNFLNHNKLLVSIHEKANIDLWYLNEQEAFDHLVNSKVYYSSTKHFQDEKLLAQATFNKTVQYLSKIEDLNNLMVLARNEKLDTDWYHLEMIENNEIILNNAENHLKIDLKDILNWNYKGVSPLYAYSLTD